MYIVFILPGENRILSHFCARRDWLARLVMYIHIKYAMNHVMYTQIFVSLPFASIQFHYAASLLPLLAVSLQPMRQDNAFTAIINHIIMIIAQN